MTLLHHVKCPLLLIQIYKSDIHFANMSTKTQQFEKSVIYIFLEEDIPKKHAVMIVLVTQPHCVEMC